MTITITTDHPASSYGIPVCLIDGKLAEDADGFRAACHYLGWDRAIATIKTGKSKHPIDLYRTGRRPIPAEVLNALRDEVEKLHLTQ